MLEKILEKYPRLTIIVQAIKYAVTALVGLIFDFASVILVKEVLGLHYLVAVCIGFLVGLTITYILSTLYVFDTPKVSQKKAFIIFGLIGLIGLGLLNLLVWALTDFVGLNYLVSKSLATIVVFAWNFIARKSIFSDSSQAS